MKVLLINLPNPDEASNKIYFLPLGILSIAAISVSLKIETKVFDFNTNRAELLENTIRNFNPDIIGIGCAFSQQITNVIKYSSIIKSINKNICVITGGMHPTLYSKDILENCQDIDYIVIGEGEDAFKSILLKFINSDRNMNDIDGIAFRENNTIIVNEKTKYSNIDDLPLPQYDLINIKDYYQDTSNWHNPKGLPINMSLPIITSRSCPLKCNFCSLFSIMGPKLRLRSPKLVVDEIEFLYNNYNHQHFSIFDDNFTLNKKHAMEICNDIIKRNLKIQIETPNGIYTGSLDKELLDAFVEAGLIRLSLAIESGSDYIRNEIMGKHLKKEKIYEVASLVKKYKDLYTRAFFIMGMPEETIETLNETYNMIIDIDIDKPIVSNLIPFPGTKLFEQSIRDNLLVNIVDINKMWSMSEFCFTDNKNFYIKPYNMSIHQLQEYREKFDILIEKNISRKLNERKKLVCMI